MAKEAIALYVESLEAHGEEVPTDAETLEYTLTMPAYAQSCQPSRRKSSSRYWSSVASCWIESRAAITFIIIR